MLSRSQKACFLVALMSTSTQRDRRWPTQRPWQASLGVSATVSPVNLAAFLLHASSSIVFLVFLNATQPFLIAQLGETKHQGALSGTLVFYDELLSMVLVLIWGSIADVAGTKPVAVAGYCFIAVALFSFTFANAPWPDLLYSRLVFAIGGSAVTAMLTGESGGYADANGKGSDRVYVSHDRYPQFLLGHLL